MSIRDDIAKLKETGRPVIGCFPLYPPLELFDAMGLVPVVLWGFSGDISRTPESDRHLQDYTCSVARRLTEFVFSDAGRYLDGVFMYNACDTLRNLPEILERGAAAAGRTTPVHRIHLPMAAPYPAVDPAGYIRDEIHSLIRELENRYGGTFSPEKFAESIRLHHDIRKLCRKLDMSVADGRMSFADFTRTVQKAGWMPADAQVQFLTSMLDKVTGTPADDSKAIKSKVILSGILPPPPEICDAIEGAGLRVVGNDIASMYRAYAGMPAPDSDPGRYYHEFYTAHFPCPTLLYTADRRPEALVDLAREREAAGMIFIGEKFCEYEYFEFPYLEKQMKAAGIQTLRLEMAMGDASAAAHRTRIEAFAEMTYNYAEEQPCPAK